MYLLPAQDEGSIVASDAERGVENITQHNVNGKKKTPFNPNTVIAQFIDSN